MPSVGDQAFHDVKPVGVGKVNVGGQMIDMPLFNFFIGEIVEVWDEKLTIWDGQMYHVIPIRLSKRIAEFKAYMESGEWLR